MSSKPQPVTVARSFVHKYYDIMTGDLQSLHRFYKEDSYFTFGTEGEEIVPEKGTENISRKIQTLGNLQDATVTVSTLDAHETLNGGYAIALSGTLYPKNSTRGQRFTQLFVLAPQDPSGYYVHNSIFRYLKESSSAAPSPEEVKQEEKEPPKEVTPAAQATPAAVAATPAAAATAPATSAVAPAPATNEGSPKEPAAAGRGKGGRKERPPKSKTAAKAAAAATQANGQNAAPAPEAPAQEAGKAPEGKKTYASILSNAPVSPTPAAVAKAPSPKPAPAAAAAPAAGGAPAPTKASPQTSHTKGGKPKPVDLPNSLFVRNVPLDLADAKALEAELAKYGKLRSLALKKGFAFVEYYNMQDIEKALQASERKEIVVGNRVLTLERRKPDKPRGPGKGGRGPRAGARSGGSPSAAAPAPKQPAQ